RKLNEPPVRLDYPGLKAGLPEITNDLLPVTIRTDFMRISGESAVTMLTMQIDHREIAFKDEGGIYRGTINLYGRISGVTSQVPSVFEDIVQTSRYTEAQISAARTQRSLYQKNVILAPGRYKVDVVARDVTSGKSGVVHHSFEVPRYGEQLSTS